MGCSLGVSRTAVVAALEARRGRVCGVLVTRPTYSGAVMPSHDLSEIVRVAHSQGVPVVVDEAHGAHLRFLPAAAAAAAAASASVAATATGTAADAAGGGGSGMGSGKESTRNNHLSRAWLELESAVTLGADLTVQSAHKTLTGALTHAHTHSHTHSHSLTHAHTHTRAHSSLAMRVLTSWIWGSVRSHYCCC